jgi:type VI secretion system protein ImpA
MASADTIDFAPLLEPIPGDSPVGEDLRTDSSPSSLYYQIKDARSAARAAERQAQTAEKGQDTAPADWRPVLKHAQKALAERTKDLEIVAYMIEALVRLQKFAGLRDGFRLARELVERYWDGLYPTPDEDGVQTRLAPLTSLNGEEGEGTLITPIAQVPLTDPMSGDGVYAAYHYQQAQNAQQAKDKEPRERRDDNEDDDDVVTMAKFEMAVKTTKGEFFVTLMEDLTQCEDAYNSLDQALQERCGSQAPPTSNIRAALAACRDVVMTVARHKLPAAEGAPAEANGEAAAAGGGADGADGAPGAGPLRNRDDALDLLLKVADFFHRTEPHTPISFALEQAVRWGRMSLPDLLTDLIEDESSRRALFHRVGIPMPTDGQ